MMEELTTRIKKYSYRETTTEVFFQGLDTAFVSKKLSEILENESCEIIKEKINKREAHIEAKCLGDMLSWFSWPLKIDIEELEFDIKELKQKITKKAEFQWRKKEIDLQEKTMLTEESERAIADTKREFINFYRQVVYLKEKIGDLTDEKREQLDMEMWLFKIKEMACIDFVTSGRLRNSTFEFLHSLPKELKLKVLPEIKDHNKLVSWYENKEETIIPKDLTAIPVPNFKQLEALSCDNISLT